MQSKDITVGTRYSWARYGIARRGGVNREYLVQVSILSEPKSGKVWIKTHEGPGNPSIEKQVPVKEVYETWDETQQIRSAEAAHKAGVVAEQETITARWQDILGETFTENETYLGFNVHGDGSYDTRVGIDRSTLAEIIEAAYASGVADGQGVYR